MLLAAKKRRNSTWFFSLWNREPQLLMRYMRWLSYKPHCNKAPHNHWWISSYLYIRQCIFILTTPRGNSSNNEVIPQGCPQWCWEPACISFIPVQPSPEAAWCFEGWCWEPTQVCVDIAKGKEKSKPVAQSEIWIHRQGQGAILLATTVNSRNGIN